MNACPASNATTQVAGLSRANGDFVELRQTLCIGRSPDCDLMLDDRRVSRRHAAIHCENGREYWLSDLGGPNGVFVNDVRVNPARRLRHGDIIRILHHQMRFLCPGERSTPSAGGETVAADRTVADCSLQERWLLVGDIRDAVGLGIRWENSHYRLQIETWMRACRSAVSRHDGQINAFTGDGFLASWPWTSNSSERVVRTLERFREMREFLPFRFRLALHLGEVMTGGWASPCQEVLLGREVNFVFRMEKVAAEQGLRVLVSAAAMAGASLLPQVRPAGPFRVPGYEGSYEFFAEV